LADELFCIAHDDRTGRARLGARALGLGLAAAQLCELVLFGRLDVGDRTVRVLRGQPPADALAHATLELLIAQPQHRDAVTWLAFLAETAVESVVKRLELAGVWQRQERRRLGRTRVSYLPADANVVAWRSIRLARLLTSHTGMDLPAAVLAGLVAAVGLTDVVLWQPESREPGKRRIAAEVSRLPPPLHRLVALTEVAVGDAVLAPR
jgi:hypothetical protein